MTAKPPPLIELHVAAAIGPNGAAYVARLESSGHAKRVEGLGSGSLRDALAAGIVDALDALKWSSAVTLLVPTGESVESIRDTLDRGEPKRAAARHRVEVRFAWPAQVERELLAQARELAGVRKRQSDGEPPEPTWRKD
jgi:hypothetical protein